MPNVIVRHTISFVKFYNQPVCPANPKICCNYRVGVFAENFGTAAEIDFQIGSNELWIVPISRNTLMLVVVGQSQVNLIFVLISR